MDNKKDNSLWDKSFSPMLLEEIDKPFDSKDYIYEMKFDGIRALIYVSPEKIKIVSKNGIDLTNLYPELLEIRHIINKKVIFDGEIVAMDNGKVSFSKLSERNHLKNKEKISFQSKANPVIYIAFDILYENKDLINLNLLDRKIILNKYKDTICFIKSKYISTNGIKLFDTIKKLDLEGIVAKNKNSIYEINKRTDNWIKIKNIKDDDFFVGGFIENKSNYTISLVLGEYRNNMFCYVGKVVLGKKRELYSKIKKERIIKNSPFIDFNDNKVNYLNPTIKCTIMFTEKTKNGHLRHPVVK